MDVTWIQLNDNDDMNGALRIALDSNNGLRISEVNWLFPKVVLLKYKDENDHWNCVSRTDDHFVPACGDVWHPERVYVPVFSRKPSDSTLLDTSSPGAATRDTSSSAVVISSALPPVLVPDDASSTTRLGSGPDNQLTVRLNDGNAPIHTSAPDASSFPKSFLSVCVPEKVNITMVWASLLAAMLQSIATDLTKYIFPDNAWYSWFVRCILLMIVGLALGFLVHHIYSKQR